ncbi:MAG: cation transporter [Myxococcales bacterium]|nr:cation transporter [Myxococcales bacterium]
MQEHTQAVSEKPSRVAPHGPERDVAVRRVLIIELFLNLLVAAAKGGYGLMTGSLTITADAMHSVVDAGANILGIFVLKQSSESPDSKHPYGHHKFEVLGAVGLGLAIGTVGVNLGLESVRDILAGGEPPETELLGVVVIVGTLLVNIFVATYEARKARELESKYLEADAAHTASDVLVTLAVLVSYGASHIGIDWADGVGALLVTIVILRVAWGVISSNLSVLVDVVQGDVERIEAVTMAQPGVEGCHRIRSHGTPDAIIVDLHAHADGDLSLHESHVLAHRIENALYEDDARIVDVTVHMEPAGDPIDHL